MEGDFKSGTCDKMEKVGYGWLFKNDTTVTVVAIEGKEYIVELKNSETTVTKRFTYDELERFINSCKGLITITNDNWKACMPILHIDNYKEFDSMEHNYNLDLKEKSRRMRKWFEGYGLEMLQFLYDLNDGTLEYTDENLNRASNEFDTIQLLAKQIQDEFEIIRMLGKESK